MLKHDDIEDKEEYKEIFKKVDEETERILQSQGINKGLGYIHLFDNCKKRLLKEKYGIDWHTTQEMNEDFYLD